MSDCAEQPDEQQVAAGQQLAVVEAAPPEAAHTCPICLDRPDTAKVNWLDKRSRCLEEGKMLNIQELQSMCFECGQMFCGECADTVWSAHLKADGSDPLQLLQRAKHATLSLSLGLDPSSFFTPCPMCRATLMPMVNRAEDIDRLNRLLTRKSEGRHVPYAHMRLGHAYTDLVQSTATDSEAAEQHFKIAAEQGIREAHYELSKLREGTEEGRAHREAAADLGHPKALLALGFQCFRGRAMQSVSTRCANCGTDNIQQQCSQCKVVAYCSRSCQV